MPCHRVGFDSAITLGTNLVALIRWRKAIGMAVKNNRTENWFSGLLASLTVPG
jgi:hypothetical protein